MRSIALHGVHLSLFRRTKGRLDDILFTIVTYIKKIENGAKFYSTKRMPYNRFLNNIYSCLLDEQ